MNKLSNKKRLAEIKATLDALEEKYKEDEVKKPHKIKLSIPDDKDISNFRHAISEYISKVSSKKLSKRANL